MHRSHYFVKYDEERSPESLSYRVDGKEIHRAKSDVWNMGNVLFYLLAKKWCFEGMTTTEAKALLARGKHSEIPSFFLNSTNAADKAMVKAIEMAWTHNPDDRPTAREIADVLQQQLESSTNNEGSKIWRVSLPPLSPGFR